MKLFLSKYNYLLLAIIFAVIISFNFTKPMGFFRESNAALVLINANVWNNNDSIRKLHVPVTSYSFNAAAEPATQLYSTCTTFGYAWFTVPYWFFQVTHIQVGEVGLRIFSLCWLLFTMLAAFLLARRLVAFYQLNKQILPLTVWFYLLGPAVLWYHVQGYVHEIAVLPFYLLAWNYFLSYLQTNNSKQLLLVGLLLIIGVQFDWLPCMQAFAMTVYLLLNNKKLKHRWAFLVPATSIAVGVGYIFYTYISWAGWNGYMEHMQSKFLSRTVGAGKLNIIPFISHHFNIILFYALGFGLTALLFVIGLIKLKLNNIIWLMVATGLLHHLIFWGFSSEHDHAAVKMGFPIAFVAAMFISRLTRTKQVAITISVLILNIGLYFFLHNFNNRGGIYTDPDCCFKLGRSAKANSPTPDEILFIDTENKYFPQIEFYAGKYYIMASSIEEAKKLLQKIAPSKKGCFIQSSSNNIRTIEHF
jgi:hypothetical protein